MEATKIPSLDFGSLPPLDETIFVCRRCKIIFETMTDNRDHLLNHPHHEHDIPRHEYPKKERIAIATAQTTVCHVLPRVVADAARKRATVLALRAQLEESSAELKETGMREQVRDLLFTPVGKKRKLLDDPSLRQVTPPLSPASIIPS